MTPSDIDDEYPFLINDDRDEFDELNIDEMGKVSRSSSPLMLNGVNL